MPEIGVGIPKLHALVIGINRYESPKRENLHGCVTDAMSVFTYLTHNLCVPRAQLLCLLDEQATRQGIIASFCSHLIDNPNIKHSDPIIIYFAGHGDSVAAPAEWCSSDGKCEMILPYDAGWSNVRKDIKSGIPPAERENFIHGIPDRTLGSLIYKLRQVKGDNITVILDSCFSGSGTRGQAKARFSHLDITPPATLDDDIVKALTYEIPPEVVLPRGTERRGVFAPIAGTHTLLAACRSSEQALECLWVNPATQTEVTTGLFTRCLLQALRDCDLDTTSYSGLMYRVVNDVKSYISKRDIEVRATQKLQQNESQTPQCEGGNQGRILFRTEFALSKSMLRVLDVGQGRYLVEAGDPMGIVVGTEFAVYPANMTPGSAPVARLVAKNVGPTKAILGAFKAGQVIEVPTNAYAQVTKFNDCPNGVRVLITERSKFGPIWEKVFNSLASLPINVVWSQPGEISDLVLNPISDGADLHSQIGVPPVEASTKTLKSEDGAETLTEILAAVIRFHFYLRRKNIDQPLREQLDMKLFELNPSTNSSSSWGPRNYLPEENPTNVFGDSLASGATAELRADPKKRYGIELSNTSDKDLFPYVLYYDLEDYSIGCLYGPPGHATSPPLAKTIGRLPIGYGSSGLDPFQVEMSNNSPRELGFFVLFVATQWVDIAHMTQESPFQKKRSRTSVDSVEDLGVWDTVVVNVSLLK